MRRMAKCRGSPILVTASKTRQEMNCNAITKTKHNEEHYHYNLDIFDMQHKIMFMNVQKVSQTYSLLFGNHIEQSILHTQHPPHCVIT